MHRQDWFKDAVIYELYVRAFRDSNGDGFGDLAGVVEKLDYLTWLGVDVLWLLPIYPSPLRDDGYDISDYYNVHEQYGTLGDFTRLLEEAHARGLKVITDLVLNHTSDRHPWFQESRRSDSNPKSDWYVWTDDPARYAGTRVIFTDSETSNWTHDPVRGQYYWHRFFRHQPDLNFDNPDVQEEMKRIVRFWVELGIDGFRMDAIPYLFEREGTINENIGRRTPSSRSCGRTSKGSDPACSSSARSTSGPRTPCPTSATEPTRCRSCSTSRSCRACTRPWRRGSATASNGSSTARRRSPTPASGSCSCATTTSSPWRW